MYVKLAIIFPVDFVSYKRIVGRTAGRGGKVRSWRREGTSVVGAEGRFKVEEGWWD